MNDLLSNRLAHDLPFLSNNTPPLAENVCYTKSNVINCSYMWIINNFSFRRENLSVPLQSTTFYDSANDKIKWCLKVCDGRGVNEGNDSSISVLLNLVSSNQRETRGKVEISLLNAHRERIKTKVIPNLYIFDQGKDLEVDFLVEKRNPNYSSLYPRDVLIIYCKLSVLEDKCEVLCRQKELITVPRCNLSIDISQLLEEEEFSDVTLSASDGHEFPAHKNILAVRSPVFKAMFTHEMEERKNNRVEIDDVSQKVLREMLYYIYTDKVENLDSEEKLADDLLAAADKYGLERLKMICESKLSCKLSVVSAADTLILAHKHSASSLKSHTIHFINTHAKEVMDTSGWSSLISSHPDLIKELFDVATQRIPTMNTPPGKRARFN